MWIRAAVLTVAALLTAHGADIRELHRHGGFAQPVATLDQEGNLYVADKGHNRVVKFSPTGDSLAAVSGSGWGATQFDGPAGIAVRGVDVFVADHGNHRVQRFDRTLNFVATLFTRESPREADRFGYPRDIAVSPQGDLYILDGENNRVVKVTPFSQVERAFGGTDAGVQRLHEPTCICAEPTGMVDVMDDGAIKRFDAFGTPRGTLPAPDSRWCATDGGDLYILTGGSITRAAPANAEPSSAALPASAVWLGFSVAGRHVAAWTDTEVVVFQLSP